MSNQKSLPTIKPATAVREAVRVCRTCLAHDTRMYKISHTPLKRIYERLTYEPLNTPDEKPDVVCYMCHHIMRKFQDFSKLAIKSNNVLHKICTNKIVLQGQSFTMVDQRVLANHHKPPVSRVCSTVEKINITREMQDRQRHEQVIIKLRRRPLCNTQKMAQNPTEGIKQVAITPNLIPVKVQTTNVTMDFEKTSQVIPSSSNIAIPVVNINSTGSLNPKNTTAKIVLPSISTNYQLIPVDRPTAKAPQSNVINIPIVKVTSGSNNQKEETIKENELRVPEINVVIDYDEETDKTECEKVKMDGLGILALDDKKEDEQAQDLVDNAVKRDETSSEIKVEMIELDETQLRIADSDSDEPLAKKKYKDTPAGDTHEEGED